MPTIEEELELVYQEAPDFAPRVARAIEEGRLIGSDFSTCFYGQVCAGNADAAARLTRRICNRLGISYFGEGTPIEVLLEEASGYTQDHPEMARLYQALQPYLGQSK